MSDELFSAAPQNPALMQEIGAALQGAAGSLDVSSTDGASALATHAAQDPAFRALIEAALAAVAARNGLTFAPAQASTPVDSEALVNAVSAFQANKDNPTQIPIDQAIVLLFVSASLIFVPSVFQTDGVTMGLSGPSDVDGITHF